MQEKAKGQGFFGEELMDTYFTLTPDLFLLIDGDGRIKDCRAGGDFGQNAPPEMLIGRCAADLMPPPARDLLLRYTERALKEKGIQRFEYDKETPRGLHRFECRLSQGGEAQDVLAVIRDITQEYRAAQELAFQSLLENVPYIVFLADLKQGNLVYCNQKAKEKFVCRTADGAEKTVGQIFDDPGQWEELLGMLRQDGSLFERETAMVDGGGALFWTVLSASVVDYRNEPAAMISIRDITPQKAAQQALEVEKVKLRERMKEHNCLQSVRSITIDRTLPVKEMLHKLTEVIGTGFMYSDITEVQIEFDGEVYATKGFRATPWRLTEEAGTLSGQPVKLTVAYLEERQASDEGPFLKEERILLDNIVKRLALTIDNRRYIESIGEQEKLLQIVFEHVAESVALIDPKDAGFVLFNDRTASSLGYTKEEFASLHVWDFAENETREEILDYLGRVSRGSRVSFEAVHRRKDGERRSVQVSLSPLSYGGRPLICETVRDITEEKKRAAERQMLTDDLKLYNHLLGEIGTMASGIGGDIEGFSKEVAQLLGEALSVERVSVWRLSEDQLRLDNIAYYKGDEKAHATAEPLDLREFPVFDLFFNARRFTVFSRDSEVPVIRALAERNFITRGVETFLQCGIFAGGRPVGTISFSYLRRHAWTNEESTFFCQVADQLGMAFLNRSKEDAVNALRVSETFLNRAQKVAKTGHWHYNAHTDRLTWSQESYRIFGIPFGTPLNYDLYMHCIHPEDRERVAQEYAAARETRTAFETRHRVVVEGEIFWVNVISEFDMDPEGNLVSLGTVQDITEAHLNYLELEKYRNNLEELVEVRTKELQAAKLEADNASQAKSLFLSNMSHEIRTPLNAVIGYAHLVKREPLTQYQSEQLDRLTAAAQNLLAIINDILDISKIEAHKIVLDTSDFEPTRVIDHICSIVADTAQKKDLNMLVDLDGIPQVLRGDGGRLGQILLNLLSNAVKFTDKGGITIKGRIVEKRGKEVRLRFEIIDTGIGIDPADSDRLFDVFEQADVSTTRRYGGTGLGLAISKQLTELMGGKIGVTSAPGMGSTFFVEIPFESTCKQTMSIAHLEPLEGKKAIVIDNKPEAREILSEMLSGFGLSVDSAPSGKEGLAKLKKSCRSPDGYKFLVVDFRMPDMNGAETVKKMRAMNLPYPPEIIMVTAYGTELSGDDMREAGISAILEKPVTPSRINDTLTELLGIEKWKKTMTGASPYEKEMQGRRGAHLLLVEDNEINQEVTVELLKAVGFQISIAQDGKTAVKMVRETPFDLILMDVQMPVMDGLQATRAIRKIRGMENVPIVAMTANAFEEDRRRCLAAGMNDHIAKPVKPENLYAKVFSWLPETPEPQDDCLPEEFLENPGGEKNGALLLTKLGKMKDFDLDAGLRALRGDHVRYTALLLQFAQSHGKDAGRMEELLALGDTKELALVAHALKGVAGTLGATEIQRLANLLERLAQKGGDREQQKKIIEELSCAMARLTEVLAAAPRDGSAVQPGPATPRERAEAAEILEKMDALLSHRDTAVNDLCEDSIDLLYKVGGRAAEVLNAQIQEYEYKKAQKTLAQMRKLI